jgi:beta-glucosidase
MMMGFPENFIWGAATASYQIEGNFGGETGVVSIWDKFCQQPGAIYDKSSGAVGSDHFHRYAEDVQLMAGLGLNAYRMSFSWARIMPDGETPSEEGLAFYDKVIDALLANQITPYVTLYHWDMPYALQLKGGYLNREIVRYFEKYVEVVAKRFAGRVKHWITVNEPLNYICCGYKLGTHAPGWKLPLHDVLLAWHHALLCHGVGVKTLRQQGDDQTRIGAAITGWGYMPADENNPADIEAARKKTFECESFKSIAGWADPMIFGAYPESWYKFWGKDMPEFDPDDMKLISQKLDFFGTNIYFSYTCRATDTGIELVDPPLDVPRAAAKWPLTPAALRWSPTFYYERYKLPVIILENGVGDTEFIGEDGCVHDITRIHQMRSYLRELRKAIDLGVDIRGYFHWSIIDDFEWKDGFSTRYGLVHVNRDTKKRTPKDSYACYREIIEQNGRNL